MEIDIFQMLKTMKRQEYYSLIVYVGIIIPIKNLRIEKNYYGLKKERKDKILVDGR